MYVILGAALVGMFLDFILNKTKLFDFTNNNTKDDKTDENDTEETTENLDTADKEI